MESRDKSHSVSDRGRTGSVYRVQRIRKPAGEGVRILQKFGGRGRDLTAWILTGNILVFPQMAVNVLLKISKILPFCVRRQKRRAGCRGSVSIAAAAELFYLESTEPEKLAKILDYVCLMTYDLKGNPHAVTGHHTALYASTGVFSEKAAIRRFDYLKNMVSREKTVDGRSILFQTVGRGAGQIPRIFAI